MIGRQKFTQQRIEKLACPDGKERVYHFDAATPSLCLCITKNGTKTFYVYRRVAGRPVRVRLGSWPQELSLEDARKAAARANGEIAGGIDPRKAKQAARAELTFGELFAKHLDHAKVHNKSWAQNQRQFDSYLKAWKSRRLSAITRADVQALHLRIGENHGEYVANRALALVAHMFNSTAPKLGWKYPNPARGIERYKEKSRERFLQADELPRFLKSLEQERDPFPDFFLVCLLTGARRGNVQAMAWADIHLERREWRIPDTKNGQALTVPLVDEVVAFLKARLERRKDSPYVFPGRSTGHLQEPKAAWDRIITRAEIHDIRIHDLRRTFGSWQAAAGVSLPIIGKSMGHKSQLTTAIYARLNIEPVRAAVTNATTAMMATGREKK